MQQRELVAKNLKRYKSNDKVVLDCQRETTSPQNMSTRLKSPSQGRRALSITSQGMFVKRSTKKLTEFKEFAITPANKDTPGCTYVHQLAFISPLKLKQLERKHGVQLTGNDKEDAEGKPTQFEVTEKQQNLLQDNEAMDEYMRSLCEKYF